MHASLRLRPQHPGVDDQRIVMQFRESKSVEHLFRREGAEIRGRSPHAILATTHNLVELADAVPVVGTNAGDVSFPRSAAAGFVGLFPGDDPSQRVAL